MPPTLQELPPQQCIGQSRFCFGASHVTTNSERRGARLKAGSAGATLINNNLSSPWPYIPPLRRHRLALFAMVWKITFSQSFGCQLRCRWYAYVASFLCSNCHTSLLDTLPVLFSTRQLIFVAYRSKDSQTLESFGQYTKWINMRETCELPSAARKNVK